MAITQLSRAWHDLLIPNRPQGQKLADVIDNAVHVMTIATGNRMHGMTLPKRRDVVPATALLVGDGHARIRALKRM